MKPLKEYVECKERFVVAHRGASGTAPENTIAAFREALEGGTHMIETDIQVTEDGKIIAFHDETFDRTVKAINEGEISPEDIENLDAGSWFGEEYSGEKIPLLEEVIEFAAGKAYIILEIKSLRHSIIEKNIGRIINIVKKFQYEEYTIFASFDHRLLASIKQIDPALHTAAIKIPGDDRLPDEIIAQTGAEGFICSLKELNEKISENVKKTGIYLGVYGVETEEDYRLAVKYNVSALGTNFPARIIKLIEEET